MKELKAYIRPSKVSSVTLALHKIEALTGMSLCEVRGFGRCRSPKDNPPIVQDLVDFVPYARLEMLCPDELEFEIVTTIQRAAFTGEPGDGKVFVTDLSQVVRIATEERGEAALQRRFCPKCQARDAAQARGAISTASTTINFHAVEPSTQEKL
ncbi:MAG: P-II family nitrogen regulator [Verrucomicrobia bacterium]|nr:P-II family nitrogen regulator [Verrucomicrobiota bacterium]